MTYGKTANSLSVAFPPSARRCDICFVLSVLVPSAQVASVVVTGFSVGCPIPHVVSATVISGTVRFRDSSWTAAAGLAGLALESNMFCGTVLSIVIVIRGSFPLWDAVSVTRGTDRCTDDMTCRSHGRQTIDGTNRKCVPGHCANKKGQGFVVDKSSGRCVRPGCFEADTSKHPDCTNYPDNGYTCVGTQCAAMSPEGDPGACATRMPDNWVVNKATGRCMPQCPSEEELATAPIAPHPAAPCATCHHATRRPRCKRAGVPHRE